MDPTTGLISREWYRFLLNLYTITGAGTGVTPIANGGTNSTSTPQSGAIAYGDGTSYRFTTVGLPGQILTSNGAGSPGWTTGVTGTVTSVDVSGGTTGFTTSGGPITSSGTITLGGTLVVANGGTNSTATPTAGAVPYGTGTAYDFTAVGTVGQVLTSAGAGTPTWATPTTGTVSSVDVSGGTTGLTTSGGPITSSGTITLAGTLIAANGGTGYSTYTIGDILYASSTTALSKLADVATGNSLISGGVGAAPSWGKIGLTTHVSGTLPIANGGTNGTATPAAGAVSYGTGTAFGFTAAGTSGQVLTSAGAGTPTWTTPTTGTVTSVGQTFTGGLISVTGSPVTGSGTLALTVAGTSGGVPYFSSASTWASSAALAANALVIGGGAGVAPATTTTGTGVVTALGTNVGTAGAFVVNGGALGTPSSGTVTNLTGTASININGTVGATTPTTGVFTTVVANTSAGVGAIAPAGTNFYNVKNITGATVANANYTFATIQSDVTSQARGYLTNLGTAATAFTLSSLTHFYAFQGTIGAGSAVTQQIGFLSESNLIGATNNYGFFANNTAAVTAGKTAFGFFSTVNIATGGGTAFGFYAAGTAPNVFVGTVNIDSWPVAGTNFYNAKNITGATTANACAVAAVVQSDVTTAARGYSSIIATAAASFSTSIQHFSASQSSIGAGSTVTFQIGFLSESNLIGATDNYGFFANDTSAVTAGKTAYGFYSSVNTASGGGTAYGFYAAGTANNYFGGNVGISRTPTTNLDVNGSIAFRAPSLTNAATYTVATTDVSLRFTTTACTVTLPAAASFTGRVLYLNNVTAIAVTSASSNVIPLGSNTAGTAILAATAGKFAMIQSDGTNWITMMAN